METEEFSMDVAEDCLHHVDLDTGYRSDQAESSRCPAMGRWGVRPGARSAVKCTEQLGHCFEERAEAEMKNRRN